MNSLTDRYTWAVVRSLPEAKRADIERELRAYIADDVEARMAGGATEQQAEHDALVALGDPDRLAVSYADRPAYLIGPRYYFDYVRLLKLLLSFIPALAGTAAGLANAIAQQPVGAIIASVITTALMVIVHLGFWTTLVFVILERSSAAGKPLVTWEPSLLPEPPVPGRADARIELCSSLFFLIAAVVAVVWQQVASVFQDAAGDPIPVLQPELWQFWIPALFALVAAEVVFAVVQYRRGWSWGLAIANTVLSALIAIPGVLLALGDEIVNPAFVERTGWDDADTVLVPLIVVMFAGIAIWDSILGFVKARRASRVAA